MHSCSLRHLESHVLLQDTSRLAAQDRGTTAQLLAHIAEVDRRGLFRDVGYPNMFAYCMGELRFSEDMAGKRITAARLVRRFPAVFDKVAEGRLTLTALCLLSKPLRPLRPQEAFEILCAAERKTNEQVRELLADRFPQPDLERRVLALDTHAPHAPERAQVLDNAPSTTAAIHCETSTRHVSEPTSTMPSQTNSELAPIAVAPTTAKTTPLSPGRYGLQLTIPEETYEKWCRLGDLLAPGVPRNDFAQRLDRALDDSLAKVEGRRFGKTDSPRKARPSKKAGHIPAAVKREVHERDGGQCTFENASGQRCERRGDRQYDHVRPKAMGGMSTAANLRLRCHAHNQLEAERMFGVEFMDKMRREGRAKVVAKKAEQLRIESIEPDFGSAGKGSAGAAGAGTTAC